MSEWEWAVDKIIHIEQLDRPTAASGTQAGYSTQTRDIKELRTRVMELENLLGRTKFSTRGAFENCILIWDVEAHAFRPAATSISIKEIVISSTDHGDLSGLGDDDHPIYAQIAGTESITGAWSFERGAGAPFVVQVGAAVVPDLDADKVDGHHLDQSVLTTASPTFQKIYATEIEYLGDIHLDARDTGGHSKVYVINTAPGLYASLDVEQNVVAGHNITCNQLQSAGMSAGTMDYDKFVVSSSGWLVYRTGNEVRADLGLASTDKPYFAGLWLTASVNLNGSILLSGTVDTVDVAGLKSDHDTLQTDVDGFPDELKNLTAGEIGELCNIGTVTITNAQWGYLGALNQALQQAATPQWAGLTLTGNLSARHILPATVDTYDLGSSTLLWRKGWLSELDTVLFAENTIQVTGGWWMIPHASGTFSTAVASGDTTIDFGQAMTVGDFLILRSSLQVEYIEIGTLVSGTTYNVTRNLDGSGANAWVQGQVYVVLGQTGDGRIEFDAQTGGPRIHVYEQGATYNAQTERVRIGDLNGWGPYSAQTYGVAIGSYADSQCIYYDPVEGLVIYGKLTCGAGQVWMSADGINLQDIPGGDEAVRQVKWYYFDDPNYRELGHLFGDYGGAQGAMWLVSKRVVDDPWGECVTTIAAQDSVAATDVRLNLYSTGSVTFTGTTAVNFNGNIDCVGSITVGGTVDGVDVDALQTDVNGFPDGLKNLTAGEITQLCNISTVTISLTQWVYLGAMTQYVNNTSNVTFNRVYISDYLYALGGIHVGGTSNPGTDKLLVDGESTFQSQVLCNSYASILGGLHIGSQSDIGDDNLVVDGDCWFGSGVWIGNAGGSTPDDNDLYIDGSINKSTALGCRAYRSTTQSISNNTVVPLSWNVQVHDTDGCFSPTSTAMYARHAGYYMAGASISVFNGGTTGTRILLAIRMQGSKYLATNGPRISSTWASDIAVTAGFFYMAANQYVEAVVYQSSGSTRSVLAASTNNQHHNSGWLVRIA